MTATLMHEWGQILGNAHVDGTIMDAGLAADIRRYGQSPEAGKDQLSSIDGDHELLICDGSCDHTYTGVIDRQSAGDAAATYARLVGQQAPATVSAAVRKSPRGLRLTLLAKGEEHSFDLQLDEDDRVDFFSDSAVLKVFAMPDGLVEHKIWRVFRASSTGGRLVLASGSILPIVVEQNDSYLGQLG